MTLPTRRYKARKCSSLAGRKPSRWLNFQQRHAIRRHSYSEKRLLLHRRCKNYAFITIDGAGAFRCLSFSARDHWPQARSKISPQFAVSVPTSGQLTTQPHAALFDDQRRRSRRGQAATTFDCLSASPSGGSAGIGARCRTPSKGLACATAKTSFYWQPSASCSSSPPLHTGSVESVDAIDAGNRQRRPRAEKTVQIFCC